MNPAAPVNEGNHRKRLVAVTLFRQIQIEFLLWVVVVCIRLIETHLDLAFHSTVQYFLFLRGEILRKR